MSAEPARIKFLFFSAMDLPSSADRDRFLLQHCENNPDLYSRVRELLAANDTGSVGQDSSCVLEPGQETDVLTFPGKNPNSGPEASSCSGPGKDADTLGTDTDKSEQHAAPALGDQIGGRYTLVQILGEGGMGTVYKAIQNEPVKRQVAIKLIKAGMDSKNVLARFDAERQALAVMDHPNIARVYDGGRTEYGQPFFVMELVTGIPVTDYCDKKRLPVRARLELFVQVCRAVQHAHQKGIIHRDLKPSNVLVTETDGKPTPKVIDFGVAKATEMKLTDLSFVDLGMIVGTPSYMSPEQTDPNSPDIDTRTDVYALGVVLYELLVGSPPLDAKTVKKGAILEILRMVREVDPPKPSTRLSKVDSLVEVAAERDIEPEQLRKALKGDLDWIVMKALEKDRRRRYETANGLAADVQRYLNSEPVTAAPPSRLYRFRKFVNKNRAAVASASLLVVALVAGIIGTYLGLIEARRQEIFAKEETAEKERARLAEAARAEGEREARLSEKAAREAAQESYEDALKNQEEKERERLRADLQAEAVQWNLYWAQMHLGLMSWREHRGLPHMKELLDHWAPKGDGLDRRGWEWFYLNSLPYQNLRILGKNRGPDNPIMVAWNLARNQLAEGCREGVVRIWDVATEKPALVIQAPLPWQDWVGAKWLGWSPDGSSLVTGGQGGEVEIWDTRTGKKIKSLEGMKVPVLSIAFNRSGEKVAAWGIHGKIRIWDVATGGLNAELSHPPQATAGEWSPDGGQLATGHENGEITFSGTKPGSPVRTVKGPGDRIYRLAWSPDGSKIASTSANDFAVRIWDVVRGTSILGPLRHSHGITALAWKAEGGLLASGSIDETVKIWDTTTGLEKITLRGSRSAVMSVEWGPGERLATGSSEGGVLIFESIEDQEYLRLPGHTSRATAVAWNPAGTLLASGGDDGFARIWDTKKRKQIRAFKGHDPGGIIPQFGLIRSLAWSPDGKKVVSGGLDGQIKGWDLESGGEDFGLQPRYGAIWAVSWNSTGSCLAAGCEDGTILLVDNPGSGGRLRALQGHRRRVRALDWNPAGNRLVSAGGDGLIKVWDAKAEKELARMEDTRARVIGVAWSRAGDRIATSHSDRFVMTWDPVSGKKLKTMVGHNDFVDGVAWTPDGGRIVSAGIDNSVRLWDPEFGEETFALRGTPGMFHGVSVNPDGARIAGAHSDGNIWIWDATKGFELDDSRRSMPYVRKLVASRDWRGDDVIHAANYLFNVLENRSGLSGSSGQFAENNGPGSPGRREQPVPTRAEAQEAWKKALEWVEEKRSKDPLNQQFAGELADLLLGGLSQGMDPGEPATGKNPNGSTQARTELSRQVLAARKIQDPRARLAVAYHLAGDQQSKENWLRIQPAAAIGMGDFFATCLDWKNACEIYSRALKDSPVDGQLLIKMAKACQGCGRTAESLPYLARAVELLPNDSKILLMAGSLQAWFNRDKEFSETCKQARRLAETTTDTTALARLGLFIGLQPVAGEGNPAMAGFSRKVANAGLGPGLDSFRPLISGMAAFRSGDLQKAETELVAALRLDSFESPSIAEGARLFLAMTLFRQGRMSEAREIALLVREKMKPIPKDPGNPLAGETDCQDLWLWLAWREASKMMKLDVPR